MLKVERKFITEEEITEDYGLITNIPDSCGHRCLRRLRNSEKNKKFLKKKFLTTFGAFFLTLKGYRPRDFASDVLCGLTVAFIRVPQGLAYGALADIAPIHGLYTELFSCLFYSILATSRHTSVGCFAVISLMTGTVLSRGIDPADYGFNSTLSVNNTFLNDSINSTIDTPEKLYEAAKVEYVVSLTCLVGLLQFGMAIFQLGRLTILLPTHVVKCFTTGAAFYVLISQIIVMLGLTRDLVPRRNGPGALFHQLYDILRNLPHSNPASIVIAICCIVILWPIKYLSRRYNKKLHGFALPGELVIILLMALVFNFWPGPEGSTIDEVGDIPSGIPKPRIPNPNFWGKQIGDAIPLAIISYCTTISLAKKYADEKEYEIDSTQECLALSVSNAIGAFFSTIPSSGSLSRTVLQSSSGGKTQIASFVSSIVVIAVVLALGPYLQAIPRASLAAIIAVNLRGMFRQFLDLPDLWRYSRVDFFVWIFGFLFVLIFGIDLGLGLAVLFLMGSLVYRSSRFRSTTINTRHHYEIYKTVGRYEKIPHDNDPPIVYLPFALNFASTENIMLELPKRSNIILDFSCVSYIDVIGMNLLKKKSLEYKNVLISGANDEVLESFDVGKLCENERIILVPTIADAKAYIIKSKYIEESSLSETKSTSHEEVLFDNNSLNDES